MKTVNDTVKPASDAGTALEGATSNKTPVNGKKRAIDCVLEQSSERKIMAPAGDLSGSAEGIKNRRLLAIEAEIPKAHSLARQSKQDLVLHATRCGLLFLAAKAEVETGKFETWFNKQKFGFSKMTRCKYSNLAERICEEAKSKPSLLLKVQSSDGGSVTFAYDESGLKGVIERVCSERSLTKLYVDWGIGHRPSGNEQSKTLHAEGTVRRWNTIVENLPKVFPSLSPEARSVVVLQLEDLLKQLKTIS